MWSRMTKRRRVLSCALCSSAKSEVRIDRYTREQKMTHVPPTFPFSFAARKSARLTSKTVLRRPMFAPW